MNLFYSVNINESKSKIILSDDENRHLIKVLRKSEGEKITITDGLGYVYNCQIINIFKKQTELKVINYKLVYSNKPKLRIGISMLKKADRFEWFLEKATEIGVCEITPIISQYSEKKKLNMERSNKIMISAIKQSVRFYLPKLNNPINFDQFINESSYEKNNFLATCKNDDLKLFQNSIKKSQDINILIGPEGGFSKSEIDLAKKTNFTPVSLAENRLRTETAGVVSCMIFSFINN